MPLYKYVCPERIDVLQKRLIRFTQPTDCNDPFELRPVVESFQNPAIVLETLSTGLERGLGERLEAIEAALPPEFRKYLHEAVSGNEFRQIKETLVAGATAMLQDRSLPNIVLDGLAQKVGILSLTEDPTNMLMWAHYAANHSGFVLVLNDCHRWFHCKKTEVDELRHLERVRYVPASSGTRYLVEMEGADVLYTKLCDWQYEREWRIVRPLEEASLVNGNIHLFAFPPELLTGVIFGLRSSSTLKSAVASILAEENTLRHVRLADVNSDIGRNELAINWR